MFGHFEKRKAWITALTALAVLASVSSGAGNEDSRARMRKDIDFLASPQCEGRGVNTAGINLAAQYIAHEFQKAGVKPAAEDGSYFQPFTIPGSHLVRPATITLRGPLGQQITLRQGTHFHPMGIAFSGALRPPPIRSERSGGVGWFSQD